MEPGNWIALLGITVTILLTVGGWWVSHLSTRLRTADQTIDTQRDTISDLRRQLDRMTITAELTDKFLTATTPPRQGPGT